MKRFLLALLVVGLLATGAQAITELDATVPANSALISTFASTERETRAKVNEIIANIPDIANWTNVTVAHTAVAGDKLLVNTSAAACTVTLPASPTAGDFVYIADAKNTWSTYNTTIARNGSMINGAASDYTLSVSGGLYFVLYVDAGYGWRVTSAGSSSGGVNTALFSLSNYSSTNFGDVIATIGSTPGVLIIDKNITLSTNASVPTTLLLFSSPGKTITVSGSVTLTFDNPSQIITDRRQIFTLTASTQVAFTKAGDVQHEWFGTDGAGFSYATAIAPNGSVVSTRQTAFTLTSGVDFTTKTISIEGLPAGGTTITSALAYAIRYSNKSSNHEAFYVKDLKLDGDNSGTNGLVLYDIARARIENVEARNFTNAGFIVDNDPVPGATHTYIVGLHFDNCGAGGNAYGWYIHGGPEEGAFQLIKISNSFAYGNGIGLYATGNSKNNHYLMYADNFEVEANTVWGIRLRNGAQLQCDTCYLEQGGGSLPDYANYDCDNGTWAKFTNSVVSMMPGDGNSSTCDTIVENSYVNAMGFIASTGRLGRGTDSTCIWSPHCRTFNAATCTETQSGSRVAKGQTWKDSAGNIWKASADGTSGSAGWDIVGDRLIIPIEYTDINGGSGYTAKLVCFETPTLVKEAYWIVTETFSGGTGVKVDIGTGASNRDVWFSSDETNGNMTAGTILLGSRNSSPTAYLTDDNGTTAQPKYLAGHTGSELYTMFVTDTFNSDATSCIVVYPYDAVSGWGTWTQGKGYLVFDVTALNP